MQEYLCRFAAVAFLFKKNKTVRKMAKRKYFDLPFSFSLSCLGSSTGLFFTAAVAMASLEFLKSFELLGLSFFRVTVIGPLNVPIDESESCDEDREWPPNP